MSTGPERLFDKNTASFAARVRKIKADSAVALARLVAEGERFDLIYIDGSHFEDDVLTDTYLAWQLLDLGGVLIWDDYHWCNRAYVGKNPKPAIDHFLARHRGEFKVLAVIPQPIIQKTKYPKNLEIYRARGGGQ